ncbi:choline-binding transcriptional repressor BetI [Planktotalea sp.]|uniref:choline-binding transcriptional repressor BetI n=1 Tax=Planktotalea sp. TaxID=2029877 RepID=UPI003D6BC6FA
MPKLGMEPIRRAALVTATIHEIGERGSLDVTVGAIAKRAGMSSALAHHYFGGKEQIFIAAMRHTLTVYGDEVRAALSKATTSHERVEAIVRASFSSSNFRADVIAAWLNFYVLAQHVPEAKRLLAIYQARLRSNLVHALRPLLGRRAPEVASRIAALIDGVYLRQSLVKLATDQSNSTRQVLDYLSIELERAA